MVLINTKKGGYEMIKTIKLGGKEYQMKASAYTQFAYKNETGRSFLDDISKLTQIQSINTDDVMESIKSLEPVINIVLDVSYIMINEATPNTFNNREEFYKSIDSILGEDNMDSITDIITLALSPIYRGNI